jgi:hypothetical protein
MDTWEPRFVDTLALHYRVVIFDNAGIGSTQALPSGQLRPACGRRSASPLSGER